MNTRYGAGNRTRTCTAMPEEPKGDVTTVKDLFITQFTQSYASLRQEILDSITSRDNYIMAMYSITTAGLCVAFELQNPILFLIPYIILFAFQNTITSKNENMIVLAAYIAVYLEEGSGWESRNAEIKKMMHEGKPFKRANAVWKFLVGRIGSVQLGMLCSISCIIYSVREILLVTQINDAIQPSIYIVLATILYVLIRVQTKDVLKLGSRRDAYIENLRKAKLAEERESEKELLSV